jgi:putative colanic acid biosynthesis acetyltransferase WcaF
MNLLTTPNSFKNPHGWRNRLGRLAWSVAYYVFFRPTPWFMGGWRSFILRCFGAKIKYARFHGSVRIWAPWLLSTGRSVYVDRNVNLYNAFGIELGDRVIISQGAFLCTATHDFRAPNYPLKGGKICVEDDCWIAAEAFLVPGIRIGQGSVVGARATVTKHVEPWTVIAGNPAKFICKRILREK